MLKTDKSPNCGFELGFDTGRSVPLFAELLLGGSGAKLPGLWIGVVSGCHHDGVVVLTNGRRVVVGRCVVVVGVTDTSFSGSGVSD